MDLDLIEKLFALLDKSSAEELEVTENGVTIRIAKRVSGALPARAAAAGPAEPTGTAIEAKPAAASASVVEIRAGMTGIFYRSPSPDAPPFVETGSRIADGDRLGLLEAMKTFNPVEAECDGTVIEILGADGRLVEAGTVLFRIERV